jgi:UDP-N-acetylmuramate dehydrogenase
MSVIRQHVDLTSFNTFHIRATASQFVAVKSPDEFLALHAAGQLKDNFLILGGGSNVLFATPEFQGLIIRNECKGIRLADEEADFVLLEAMGGEVWHELVVHCLANGWGGIENLSLIPGTVGAAPIQNIGAYGVELKDVLHSVHAIDLLSGEAKTFTNAECQFGYRDSIFKRAGRNRYFISSITLRLTRRNHKIVSHYGAIEEVLAKRGIDRPTITDISEAVVSIRSSKLPDPEKIGNAGSFFKNPSITQEHFATLKGQYGNLPGYTGEGGLVKIPAGWLIEQCGYKGLRRNAVGVHTNQALVLVNYGDGSGEDLLLLAEEIMSTVRAHFAIDLTPEVNIIR